jgi:hypothetical protein
MTRSFVTRFSSLKAFTGFFHCCKSCAQVLVTNRLRYFTQQYLIDV